MENYKIILASQSPRRKELLSLMGLTFDVLPSQKEEVIDPKLPLNKLSESLAYQKAEDVFNQTEGNRIVIGSDTLVKVGGKLFGKPKDDQEAICMLKSLSNNTHEVITSLCVLIENNGEVKKYLTHDIAKVKFLKLSDETIAEYLKSGEHKDKAGAYAVQGRSGMFIKQIKGSFASVMGLPTHQLFEILKKEGILI